jgi:hypothetical protein
MRIRPVGAELFHANRRAGMTKLVVAFRSLETHLKQDVRRFETVIAFMQYFYKFH